MIAKMSRKQTSIASSIALLIGVVVIDNVRVAIGVAFLMIGQLFWLTEIVKEVTEEFEKK